MEQNFARSLLLTSLSLELAFLISSQRRIFSGGPLELMSYLSDLEEQRPMTLKKTGPSFLQNDGEDENFVVWKVYQDHPLLVQLLVELIFLLILSLGIRSLWSHPTS